MPYMTKPLTIRGAHGLHGAKEHQAFLFLNLSAIVEDVDPVAADEGFNWDARRRAWRSEVVLLFCESGWGLQIDIETMPGEKVPGRQDSCGISPRVRIDRPTLASESTCFCVNHGKVAPKLRADAHLSSWVDESSLLSVGSRVVPPKVPMRLRISCSLLFDRADAAGP